ncbi:DUF7079 family protein [Enterovibrio norvegicus]|uniref:DUF7079 family protein n=1 Tax=Enterovibrio norvegicus TaxID=188144 RepID=UPI000C8228E3|nr:hypothetical protein [Enterovibrio norvegicus]PMN66547.1 hypothetical protein BCT27_06745 [Enterovibrio norvegicus]
MANQLTEDDLIEALSGLFIDNEIDYESIASVARVFPIEKVEYTLFSLVAPICHTNLSTPAPEVWLAFEREQLLDNVKALKARRKQAGFFSRLKDSALEKYLRNHFSSEWHQLQKQL